MRVNLRYLVFAILIAWNIGHAQFQLIPVDKPTFSPEGKTFNTSLNINLSCKNNEYVYYTLDGSYPNVESAKWSYTRAEITVKTKTTVTAMCANSFFGTSDTVVQKYVLESVPVPVLSHPAGAYEGNFYIKVYNTDPGAEIHYITKVLSIVDSEKTIKPGDSVLIKPPMTLTAFSLRSGYANSHEISAIYTKKDTTLKPTIKVKSTSFSAAFLDTITTVPGASIYFSLNSEKFQPYSGAVKIPEATTKIRAYAIKAEQVASPYDSATYTYTPKAPKPFTTTQVDAFLDTLSVTLANTLPGSAIHYTLNGKTPTLSDSLFSASKPIRIDSTRTLIARSFVPSTLNGLTYIPSDTLVRTFRLTLSPPIADFPQSGSEFQFKDSVKVTVTSANPKAIIVFTLDGKEPKVQGEHTIVETITGDTTILKAKAITKDGGISSAIKTWRYIKTPNPRPQAPVAEPSSRRFTGSLNVTIREATEKSLVIYTLDGSEPRLGKDSILDPKRPMVTISKTTTLRMRAYVGDDSSDLSEETYRQQPAAPIASLPAGEVTYGTLISLHCVTPQAEIFYTLGDSIFDMLRAKRYDASKPLMATQNFHLQAKTFLGEGENQEESEGRLDLHFTVSQKRGDTIVIGNNEYSSPPYQLKLGNVLSPAVPVLIQTTPADLNIIAQPTAFTLLKPANSEKIDVVLRPVDTLALALYEITASGLLFVTRNFPVLINYAGTFVLGRDLSAPKVRLISQSVGKDDSTIARIEIRDNIRNCSFQVQSSGTRKWEAALTTKSTLDTLILKLGNTKDKLEDLWLKVLVEDHFQSTSFPSDTTQPFVFSQVFSSVSTPKNLRLGEKDYSWDLVAFPSHSSIAPVTLSQLSEKNPETQFMAQEWNGLEKYQSVSFESPLKSGQGFWLAADKSLQSIKLPRFQTASSDSDGYFRMTLRSGWNMIGCPSLTSLKWPITRDQSNYARSNVRSLIGFSHSTIDYAPVDSLVPWKGYFVYNRGRDTTLILSRRNPNPGATKQGRNSEEWHISLGEPNRLPVLLGAFSGAKESIGSEDELALPPLTAGKERLRAFRHGRALTEDFVHSGMQVPAHFQLVFGKTENPQIIPSLQVFTQNLPSGMQAWAWLPKRGLRQELRTNQNLAWWNSNRDTLDIVVGTAAALGKLAGFTEASSNPGTRTLRWNRTGNQGQLSLQLPEAAWVDITWLSATGQSKPLFGRTFLGTGKQEILAQWPGSGWVRIQGQDLSGNPQWSQIWGL